MTSTSHAQGLIAIYKGWLQYLYNENVDELVDLATDLDMSEVQFLDKVDNLKKELSLNYGISKLGLCQDHIEKIASMVMGNVQADLSYKDINSITNILKLSL
tara:strand:- start:18380 stop:18685 length:306 start_codon:yes stop_codon:yes gene_type:complete